MATEPAHPSISYAAYRALPEGRYDLLAWVEARGRGHVYGAPLDVGLRQEDPAVVVQPDVGYVAAGGRRS